MGNRGDDEGIEEGDGLGRVRFVGPKEESREQGDSEKFEEVMVTVCFFRTAFMG